MPSLLWVWPIRTEREYKWCLECAYHSAGSGGFAPHVECCSFGHLGEWVVEWWNNEVLWTTHSTVSGRGIQMAFTPPDIRRIWLNWKKNGTKWTSWQACIDLVQLLALTWVYFSHRRFWKFDSCVPQRQEMLHSGNLLINVLPISHNMNVIYYNECKNQSVSEVE